MSRCSTAEPMNSVGHDTLLQSVAVAGTKFYASQCDTDLQTFFDKKLEELIASLQVPSVCASLDIENIATIECFNYCVSCLSLVDCPQFLAHRIMVLLYCIAYNHIAARQYMQNSLQIASCLTSYFAGHVNGVESSNHLIKCLQLLQVVTYQTDCCNSNSALYLVDLMIMQLTKSELQPFALGVLTNLCTQSMTIRDYIRRLDDVRTLYKQLMSFLQDQNGAVVVTSLSLVSRLNDELRERVFSSNNMVQTFQCMFNILIKGDDYLARHHASDLFRHILNYKHIEESIAGYKFLEPTLRQLASLLLKPQMSAEQLYKVYEALVIFCKRVKNCQRHSEQCIHLKKPTCLAILNAPPVDQNRLTTPLLAIVECVRNIPCNSSSLLDLPLLALQLLTFAFEEVTDTFQHVLNYVPNEVLLTLIEDCLKTTIETGHPLVRVKCERMSRCVELVSVLLNDTDVDLANDILQVCNANLFAHLAEFQMLSNPIAQTLTSGRTLVSQSEWAVAGVDLLLNLLHVVLKLGPQSLPHQELYERLTQDTRLLPFLAYALTSESRYRVQRALNLLLQCSGAPGMCSALSHLIATNVTFVARSGTATIGDMAGTGSINSSLLSHMAVGNFVCINGTGFNSTGTQQNGTELRRNKTGPRMSANAVESSAMDAARIDELIAEMKTLNMKDTKMSQLIAVYERKVSMQEAKERHLKQLLDSNTAALQHANNMLSEYMGGHRREIENETSKLRSLILESEIKCEQSAAHAQKVSKENLQLQEQIATLKNELEQRSKDLEGWADLESTYKARITNMQSALETSKKDIDNERELYGALRQRYDNMKQNFEETSEKLLKADDEIKSLRKRVKEKEQEIAKLSEAIASLETSVNGKEEEMYCLERNVEKLRENMQSLEREKQQLQKQVVEKENDVLRKTSTIREHESTIAKLNQQINKFSEIQSMIRNLTSSES